VKEALRRMLRAVGYDLHRYIPANVPDAQIAQVLRSFGIDLVLDVGANTGQYGRLLRGLGYRGRIVSFEPLAEAHRALAAAVAGDASWTAAPRTAVGDHDGEIVINIAANSASSSVRPMLESHRDAAPHATYVGSETTPIATLDSLSEAWLPGARAMVKIDTQGYEAQVIAGGATTLAQARAVQIELSLVPLYDGQAGLEEMLALMAGHGLALWAIWPGFVHPVTGRVLQAEAVFARPEAVSAQPEALA
jgi:FkbM family methyltransferase